MKPTLIVACLGLLSVAATGGATAQTTNFTVIASGLDGPRGMKFGPDGNLYVAEAGTGGPNTTVGLCTQGAGAIRSLLRRRHCTHLDDPSRWNAIDRG